MNIHKNARLTPRGRERMVRAMESGRTPEAAARDAGVCPRTARKWLARHRNEGAAGLRDRSSRPHRLRRPAPLQIVEHAGLLRRRRMTGRRIAKELGLSPATVLGLRRLKDLLPAEPVRRYERAHPGELLHIDLKKLNRFDEPGHRMTGNRRAGRSDGAGWEFVHVRGGPREGGDASRVAFSRIMPGETAVSAIAFLKAALAYYERLGVKVRRVMTDNGPRHKSFAFARFRERRGLRHIRTRPYTPRTNGKAERFIQTALREWAYARLYGTSDQRAQHPPLWLHGYNWHRPHASLKANTPISRLGLAEDNLLRLHS